MKSIKNWEVYHEMQKAPIDIFNIHDIPSTLEQFKNHNKMKKPSQKELDQLFAITNYTEAELDFIQAYDWTDEIFEIEGKYGIKSCTGEQLVAPEYENFKLHQGAPPLKKNSKITAQRDGFWGVLIADGNGNWLIEPEYDYLGCPNTLLACCKKNKWGVLNLQTKDFLIPLICDSITEQGGYLFSNGVSFYEVKGKHGVILINGEFTQAIFDEIYYEIDEVIKARIGETWGYINQEGELTEDSDEAYFLEEL